jgi:hypothetical protein
VESEGLSNDVGFQVTGPFTFDTSGSTSPTPSVTYDVVSGPIVLTAGSYETSTNLNVDISDSANSETSTATGYLLDYQVLTQLCTDANCATPVMNSGSSGGQTGFPATGYPQPGGPNPFCPLSTCTNISSGDNTGFLYGGPFNLAAGTYYLQQTFTAAVTGVNSGDVITLTMPNTSGVGTAAPEPGYWGAISAGLFALVFARRRYTMKVVRN